MKRFFRELIFLSKGERTALFVVLVLLILALVIKVLVFNRPLALPDDNKELEALLEEWRADLEESARETNMKPHVQETGKVAPAGSIFYFDPNKLPLDSLELLGLSKRAAENIVRYREAGGYFKQPEDLEKIYSLDATLLRQLRPYVRIPDPALPERLAVKKSILPVELNTATTDSLLRLPGIGNVFAKRIIEYRDKLGGFSEPIQLLEVYGMDSIRYGGIEAMLSTDSSLLKKIDLNTADYQTLIRHPYLNKSQVNAILSYRRFAGRFVRREELLENHILADTAYRKIENYLLAGSQN